MRKFVFALCFLSLAGATARASSVIYSNGPVNGAIAGWTINSGFAVEDSFTVSSTSTLTSLSFYAWAYPGDTMTSVDWGIESTPGGYPDSFTAATTQAFQYHNTMGYDIDLETIALSGTYAPGTYWLTLQNGVTSNGNSIYWDINNGPSVAYENTLGNVANYMGSGSNSTAFTINGTTATPEPSSLLLLGSGLAGIVGMIRRRVKA